MNKLPGHQGRKTQGDCHVNGPEFPTLDSHHEPYLLVSLATQEILTLQKKTKKG